VVTSVPFHLGRQSAAAAAERVESRVAAL